MPSPFEERFSADAAPQLMEQFANPDIRQRRAADDYVYPWPVRGIWMPDLPDFDPRAGQKIIHTGRLTVEIDDDVPLLETDQWEIREDDLWQVDKERGGIGTRQFGLVTVFLKKVQTLHKRSQSPDLR